MKERIIEYSHNFHQNYDDYNESNSSLGSPKPEVRIYDGFVPSYLARSDFNDSMPLPGLEQKNGLPVSLSHDLAPKPSSHMDVTKDVLPTYLPL